MLSYDFPMFEYGAYSVFIVKVRYVDVRILLTVNTDKVDQGKPTEQPHDLIARWQNWSCFDL